MTLKTQGSIKIPRTNTKNSKLKLTKNQTPIKINNNKNVGPNNNKKKVLEAK